MENFRLFGAPHALVVTTDEALGIYGVLDCGAWVNNFMLAAAAAGVACIAQAALAAHPKVLREFFGIGEDRRIVCGMSFGYEDAKHPANQFRTSRATKEEVATWIES
jgi:nitroreductase